MARTVHNAKIDTRSARLKLERRREPYWTTISKGCAVGYRRTALHGTWVARLRDQAGRQRYEALGPADDYQEANGQSVLSFADAIDRARSFFSIKGRDAEEAQPPPAKVTTDEILAEYFSERERLGAGGLAKDKAAALKRISPSLGNKPALTLPTQIIRDWHARLARLESAATGEQDPEKLRAKRATANRTLTVLKAALNHYANETDFSGPRPWANVKPFKGVDTPVVRFLTEDECHTLIQQCEPDFRNLVRGALLTGCRYGELSNVRARDFNRATETLTIRKSKPNKWRHVSLNREGLVLLETLSAGKAQNARLFERADERAWKASDQQRPIAAASQKAGINPSATFHTLRHTYASTLAMRGVPITVIAKQLGHADTRVTEKHYAHLSTNYLSGQIRNNLPSF